LNKNEDPNAPRTSVPIHFLAQSTHLCDWFDHLLNRDGSLVGLSSLVRDTVSQEKWHKTALQDQVSITFTMT
jgi:hypothetical protein